MNMKTKAVVFISMLVLLFSTAACKQSGEAEKAGGAVSSAVEDGGKVIGEEVDVVEEEGGKVIEEEVVDVVEEEGGKVIEEEVVDVVEEEGEKVEE